MTESSVQQSSFVPQEVPGKWPSILTGAWEVSLVLHSHEAQRSGSASIEIFEPKVTEILCKLRMHSCL